MLDKAEQKVMKLRLDETGELKEVPLCPGGIITMELMTQLRADQTRIEKALADYAAQWPSLRRFERRHVL